MHAGELEVKGVGGRSVVADEGGEAFGARNREGKLAEDRLGGLTGQDGVCALCKTHPAVAFQQARMLRGARWNNARPNRELSGRGIVMQKLDA